MLLYYTERSPFARKVRMVATHHDLMDEIKLVFMMPTERKPELMSKNPQGKIPVLALPNNKSLIDSPVISKYLDSIGKNRKLLPRNQMKRIDVLQHEALGDGIMDAAVAMVMESWRPKEYQWPGQFEKQTDNILRTIITLESNVEFFHEKLTLAHLSLASALDYVHHRLAKIDITHEWLASAPKLAKWYKDFQKDPIMQNTAPKEGW